MRKGSGLLKGSGRPPTLATEERILGCPLRNLAWSSTHCVACGEVASERACSRRIAWLGLGFG